MFFGVPGFTNTPVQKRGNQCFTESKSFGSIFDSEQSSTWLKNVQTIQNDRQHLLHGTRFTKVDQRLGPGIRSGHLWWMIGNAHENRNAHLVMVQTWAPKKKCKSQHGKISETLDSIGWLTPQNRLVHTPIFVYTQLSPPSIEPQTVAMRKKHKGNLRCGQQGMEHVIVVDICVLLVT